ncbi:hypothetical protein BACCAP_02381 [Pseudoflavonifractor capillosus ATCC 29799]|uniref:Uncharacterized protein n=1 Tax=Pseudoflavonifractor capillosus ATCC 29799 TaxID=411467 RepID=A6NVY8_9FIRM|nr:hypothetical protein BACCAP_02381 [Pseudoflavonifractor capillosus ATCC 29799]
MCVLFQRGESYNFDKVEGEEGIFGGNSDGQGAECGIL